MRNLLRELRTYDLDNIENRDPAKIENMIRLIKSFLWRYFRPVIRGIERIPPGAGLYVGNHNAGMLTPDTFVFGAAVYEQHGIDAIPYGLGHEVAISIPLIHQWIVPLGAVRASHDNAHRLFEHNKKVLVYPGGDIDAMRPYRHRNRIIFGPRRGYIRLALRENVPIIPVVTAGAHETCLILDDGRWLAKISPLSRLFRLKVCPIAFSLPWGLTIGFVPPHLPLRTQIYMEVLDPIRFERYGAEAAQDNEYVEACHHRVHSQMEQALQRLAEERSQQ